MTEQQIEKARKAIAGGATPADVADLIGVTIEALTAALAAAPAAPACAKSKPSATTTAPQAFDLRNSDPPHGFPGTRVEWREQRQKFLEQRGRVAGGARVYGDCAAIPRRSGGGFELGGNRRGGGGAGL